MSDLHRWIPYDQAWILEMESQIWIDQAVINKIKIWCDCTTRSWSICRHWTISETFRLSRIYWHAKRQHHGVRTILEYFNSRFSLGHYSWLLWWGRQLNLLVGKYETYWKSIKLFDSEHSYEIRHGFLGHANKARKSFVRSNQKSRVTKRSLVCASSRGFQWKSNKACSE